MWSLPPHSHSRAFKSPLPQIAMGGRRHNSPLLRQKTSLLLPQQKFFLVFQTRGRYLEISFLHSNATMCQISSTSRFVFPDFRVYLTSDLSDIDYTGPEFCKREKKIVSKTFLLTLKMGGFNSFVVHHRKRCIKTATNKLPSKLLHFSHSTRKGENLHSNPKKNLSNHVKLFYLVCT